MIQSNITIGADSKLEREKKWKALYEQPKIVPSGFCGICQTRYLGNYTNHTCKKESNDDIQS